MANQVSLAQLPSASAPAAGGLVHGYDPTQPAGSRDVALAATAFTTPAQAAAAAPVQTVAGRAGAVVLAVADVSGAAPLASPTFTGTATAAKLVTTGNTKVATRNSSAQSIPNNTATVVTGWANVIDANGEFNASTGTFTAGAAGNYQVSAQLSFNGAMAVNSLLQIQLFANGSNFVSGQTVVQNATPTTNVVTLPGYLVALSAGQTIQIKALQSSGGAIPLVAAAASNYLSIVQIP
jgi:hypothetical protein